MANESQEPKPPTENESSGEAKHPWPLNALQEAYPTLKILSIPLVCIFIGGITISSLYSIFIIPGKEETVKSVSAERDLYKAELEWPIKHTTNAVGEVAEQTNTATNFKSVSNTNIVVSNPSTSPQASDEKVILSPEAVARIKAKLATAPHVPVRVIIPKDDLDALSLATQIQTMFVECGFDVKHVEKADYKQPHIGITLVFKNKPTGILWDSLFQIWFELLQTPYTDYEDAMSGSDIWIFVTTK